MKIIALFSTILFTLFAVVQYNDPDPVIWITIYGYATVMSFLILRGTYFLPGILAGAAFYLIGGILYFPDSVKSWIIDEWNNESLSMKTVEMEYARESFGMLIAFLFMAIFILGYFINQKNVSTKKSVQTVT